MSKKPTSEAVRNAAKKDFKKEFEVIDSQEAMGAPPSKGRKVSQKKKAESMKKQMAEYLDDDEMTMRKGGKGGDKDKDCLIF